jgi:hypothetical protein
LFDIDWQVVDFDTVRLHRRHGADMLWLPLVLRWLDLQLHP